MQTDDCLWFFGNVEFSNRSLLSATVSLKGKRKLAKVCLTINWTSPFYFKGEIQLNDEDEVLVCLLS